MIAKYIKQLIISLYYAGVNTIKHDGVEHAGYMAFLTILALFPFLVFLTAIASLIGESQIGLHFINLLLQNIPEDVANAISPRVQEISYGRPQGILTLAIVGAIWTASSAVEGFRTILNRVYRVVSPPAYISRRMLSVLQFLILTCIIIVTMSILVVTPIMIEKFNSLKDIVGKLSPIWLYVKYVAIFITLFLVVGLLYFLIPNVRLKFLSVLPGAILVVLLWVVSGNLLSKYLKHFNQVSNIYGGLGGIIVSLIFFYIINMIFIYGAEFNYLVDKNFNISKNKT